MNRQSGNCFQRWLFLWGTVCFLLLVCTNTASAKQCRRLTSVKNSAGSVTANFEAGGNVWEHVAGMEKEAPIWTALDQYVAVKSGRSQEGQSLFKNEDDFLKAFSAWSEKAGSVGSSCEGGEMKTDEVPADDLGINHLLQCTAVHASKRHRCKETKRKDATSVCFIYENLGSNKWILQSAFPTGGGCDAGTD